MKDIKKCDKSFGIQWHHSHHAGNCFLLSRSFHGNVNQEMYNTVDALIRFLLRHSTRSCHTLTMYRVLQGALLQVGRAVLCYAVLWHSVLDCTVIWFVLQDQEGLIATMKHLDSELMQSVMRQRTKQWVSMNIAKWAVSSSRQTEVSRHVSKVRYSMW